MPWLNEAYYGELEREHWGLNPVAQLDNYKGLFFATFDPDAPPLREYLGEMTSLAQHRTSVRQCVRGTRSSA